MSTCGVLVIASINKMSQVGRWLVRGLIVFSVCENAVCVWCVVIRWSLDGGAVVGKGMGSFLNWSSSVRGSSGTSQVYLWFLYSSALM